MFSKLNNLPFFYRLLIIGAGLPILLMAVLFYTYANAKYDQKVEEYLEKARTICRSTEAVREEMEKKWSGGLLTREQLRAYADDGDLERIMLSVPVVTAWNAAMSQAQEGSYTFKVPKFQPRNPDNEPDNLEAEALRYMEANNVDEYPTADMTPVVDAQGNLRYFRSIKLDESCLLCHGDPADSSDIWGNDQGLDPTGARMEGWQTGERHGAFEVVQSLQPAQKEYRESITRAGFIFLGAVAGFTLVFHQVSRRFTRPLHQVVDATRRLAEGDLTGTVQVDQNDEVGILAKAMNESAASLRDLLMQLLGSANELQQSSTQLDELAQGITNEATTASQNSQSVASAGEQLSANVHSMSNSADQLSKHSSMVAASIEEMSATINEVARNCADESQKTGIAREKAQEANSSMSQLESSANEINQVLEIIRNVADQTNLLALNATIEAASAGEAGKGFAVVANEVKELSRQTADATSTIYQKIEIMQDNVSSSTAAIGEIAGIIEDIHLIAQSIAAAVEEQSATASEITRSMTGITTAITELAANVREAAEGSNDVSRNIQDINQSLSQTTGRVASISEQASQLKARADDLSAITHRFKV